MFTVTFLYQKRWDSRNTHVCWVWCQQVCSDINGCSVLWCQWSCCVPMCVRIPRCVSAVTGGVYTVLLGPAVCCVCYIFGGASAVSMGGLWFVLSVLPCIDCLMIYLLRCVWKRKENKLLYKMKWIVYCTDRIPWRNLKIFKLKPNKFQRSKKNKKKAQEKNKSSRSHLGKDERYLDRPLKITISQCIDIRIFLVMCLKSTETFTNSFCRKLRWQCIW